MVSALRTLSLQIEHEQGIRRFFLMAQHLSECKLWEKEFRYEMNQLWELHHLS
ncbi:unnamed protein product [Brassica rapa subsp. trilocularis]